MKNKTMKYIGGIIMLLFFFNLFNFVISDFNYKSAIISLDNAHADDDNDDDYDHDDDENDDDYDHDDDENDHDDDENDHEYSNQSTQVIDSKYEVSSKATQTMNINKKVKKTAVIYFLTGKEKEILKQQFNTIEGVLVEKHFNNFKILSIYQKISTYLDNKIEKEIQKEGVLSKKLKILEEFNLLTQDKILIYLGKVESDRIGIIDKENERIIKEKTEQKQKAEKNALENKKLLELEARIRSQQKIIAQRKKEIEARNKQAQEQLRQKQLLQEEKLRIQEQNKQKLEAAEKQRLAKQKAAKEKAKVKSRAS